MSDKQSETNLNDRGKGSRRGRARLTVEQRPNLKGDLDSSVQGHRQTHKNVQVAAVQGRGQTQRNVQIAAVQGRGQNVQGRGKTVQSLVKNVQDLALRGRGRGRGLGKTQINDQVVTQSLGRGRGRGRGRGIRISQLTDQFIQATSSNLPQMDFMEVAEYFQRLRSPELRQAKDAVSAHADYGDNAVGYVQLRINGTNCIVQARLTPQTSVNKTPYVVSVSVDETSNAIVSAECNCQASSDQCKHQTALIFWLLRRSEEPSPTEVACYWKKSVLSTVREQKAKTVDELSKRSTELIGADDSLLQAFIERGKDTNKTAFVIRYSQCRQQKNLYMDHLMIWFNENHSEDQRSCQNFLSYCSEQMTQTLCEKVYEETVEQNSKAEWYYQRFGRITASKLFEASRCKTTDGSLVAGLLGARSFKGNKATRRGQFLECKVLEILKTKFPNLRKCGILLNGKMPIFGASPDGATDDAIFEIKCPQSEDTVSNYIEDGVLKNKVYFQMQLQMLMANKAKGVLVIADPKFEKNKKIRQFDVKFDEIKLKPLLSDCEIFWKRTIFPLLK